MTCACVQFESVISLSMRGSVLKSALVSFIAVSLSVLAPVACLAQAQQVPQPSESAAQIPDAPSALARISGSQVTPNFLVTGSAPNLVPESSQYESLISSFRSRIQDRPDQNHAAMPHTDTTIDGISLMFAPVRMHPKVIHSADDWQYYGHHIPVAGPLVLRVGHEAQAHPHVTTVFKMIQPQF